MRRYATLFHFVSFLFCHVAIIPEIFAQERSTNDTATSLMALVSHANALAYNNAVKLVRNQDGHLHLTFHNQGEIYYCTSTDNGASWSMPLNVSNTAGLSLFPALAIDSANRKHFVWEDDSSPYDLNAIDGKRRIWYKNFIDAASSSSRYPYVIGEAVGDVQTPSIAVRDERTLLAAWAAYTGVRLGWEINVSTGTLIGNGLLNLYDWTYPTFHGEAVGISSSFFPAISTLGNVSYVAWQELNAFSKKIADFKYYRGGDWSGPQGLTTAAIPYFPSEYDIPAIILSQDTTAFFGVGVDFDVEPPVFDVYAVSHKNMDTLKFGDGVKISNTPERERGATFAITLGNELVLAWQTIGLNTGIICFSKTQLAGYDKTWSAPICVSDESTNARDPQVVAITQDTLLFVWLQGNSAPYEIIAQRYPPLITAVDNADNSTFGATTPINAAIFPNPVESGTTFEIKVAHSGVLSAKIYNIQGQLVKSITEERVSVGAFRYSWDARDRRGRSVPNGVYIAVFQLGHSKATKRILVLKQ